jgi:hypothetical protein
MDAELLQAQPYSAKCTWYRQVSLGQPIILFENSQNLYEFIHTLLRFIRNSGVAEHARPEIDERWVRLNKERAMFIDVNIFICWDSITGASFTKASYLSRRSLATNTLTKNWERKGFPNQNVRKTIDWFKKLHSSKILSDTLTHEPSALLVYSSRHQVYISVFFTLTIYPFILSSSSKTACGVAISRSSSLGDYDD